MPGTHDVQQLVINDPSYQFGLWGFRSWLSSAEYAQPVFTPWKPECFVVMPFEPEFNFVYKNVIKEVVESYDFVCRRADEILVSRPAVEDVKEQISAADLVIVDFTNRNPNVYYEAGLADAWKKKWIVLAQSPDDLTFDVKQIKTIFYSSRLGGDEQCVKTYAVPSRKQ